MNKSILALLLPSLLAVNFADASPATVKEGDPAPMIEALNQDSKWVKLADFKGRPIVLFFYPKDDTPGCTKQACKLRDGYREFQKRKVAVFGVSRQSAASHAEFRTKHKLPYDLLVDEDGAIGSKFGIDQMPIVGFFKRQTVLIGADGKILRIFRDVDPETHDSMILETLASTDKP